MRVHPGDDARRRLVRAILVAALVVLVALCLVIVYIITSRDATLRPEGSVDPTTSASPSDELVLEQYAGLPDGAAPGDLGAVVMADEGTIHVFTMGSSSCPAIPTEVTADGDGVVVTVDSTPFGACTADYAPTTSVVAIPEDYQGAEPPVVRVESAPS